MFRFGRIRLRRIHSRFLDSCRSLADANNSRPRVGGLAKWFLESLMPVPLLGLTSDGAQMLEALEWLEHNARLHTLSEEVIQSYHRMISARGLGRAGEYRKHEIKMPNNTLIPPSPHRIPSLMKHLANWVGGEQARFDAEKAPTCVNEDSVIRLAVEVYYRIGVIHPFDDANGRTARLSMNHVLRRYGAGYVIFPPLREEEPLWKILQDPRCNKVEELARLSRILLHRP